MSTRESCGFEAELWEKGKLEAICAIVRVGKKEDFISYGDLARAISNIRIEPHGPQMNQLLDQISKAEDAAGRGILTALGVLQGTRVPADGFWASAADIGRDVRDKWAFWSNEVKRVMDDCKKHPLCP